MKRRGFLKCLGLPVLAPLAALAGKNTKHEEQVETSDCCEIIHIRYTPCDAETATITVTVIDDYGQPKTCECILDCNKSNWHVLKAKLKRHNCT